MAVLHRLRTGVPVSFKKNCAYDCCNGNLGDVWEWEVALELNHGYPKIPIPGEEYPLFGDRNLKNYRRGESHGALTLLSSPRFEQGAPVRTYKLHLHILDRGWELALLEDDVEKTREVCSSFRDAHTKGANWSLMLVTPYPR